MGETLGGGFFLSGSAAGGYNLPGSVCRAPLGAGTAKREGERVRGGKGVPVAFHPPDLIACFMPQPPSGNRQTSYRVTD